MPQKRNPYQPRLDKDTDTRLKIVLMRMAGCPVSLIAEKTERHIKTIEKEIKRPVHNKLRRKYMKAISRSVNLRKQDWEVIEQYLKEREVVRS